jgi:hypothetical protein
MLDEIDTEATRRSLEHLAELVAGLAREQAHLRAREPTRGPTD